MPRGASLTAEVVCLCRAWERHRPARERVVDDPWAHHFLGPQLKAGMLRPVARALAGSGRVSISPGGMANFVVARHRFIDDALDAALRRGVAQVVVLGAGYDTRGFRFAEPLGGRPVFEVDFPATQARKVKLLRRARGLPWSDVRHVAVDFERDRLDERLEQADGFRVGAPTFFVWEGVTMYLSKAAVEETLRVMERVSGPGSEVVADFWDRPLPGSPWRKTLGVGEALLRRIGEPIDFSISPEDVSGFLLSLGLSVQDVARAPELRRRFDMGGRRLFPAVYLTRAQIGG